MDGPLEACRDRTQRSIERSVHEGNVRYERDENYPPSRQHYRSTNQHGRHEERTEIFHPSKRRQTSEGHRRDHQRHGDFHDHRREIEPRPPNHRTGQPYRELHHGRSLQHKTSSSCRPSDIKGDRHKRYYVKEVPKDERLPDIVGPDPRGDDPNRRVTRKATNRGAGRNTESFDPASTLVRPELRILVGSPQIDVHNKPLKHDDVVIVPELFGAQENWDMYYNLVEEMTAKQEWVSWHEGLHLIVKKPEQSPLFNNIVDRLCTYFKIRKQSIGYRFNWYKDSSDWKAFHHDSAAFNPQRAKNQNITIGASFGATRELAFVRATDIPEAKVRVYFPQTNNGVFTFGRDVNILWKHGINALAPEEQDGKGRISIILWGLAQDVIEETGSPPLLGSDGQGPHAQQLGGKRHYQGNNSRNHDHRGESTKKHRS